MTKKEVCRLLFSYITNEVSYVFVFSDLLERIQTLSCIVLNIEPENEHTGMLYITDDKNRHVFDCYYFQPFFTTKKRVYFKLEKDD